MSATDRMPPGWIAAPLSQLCERLVDGSHLPPAKQKTGRPMLSAKNIGNGTISLDGRLITPEAFELEDARTRVRPGDVLLTIVGTIGRAAVVPDSLGAVTLQRSVAVLKPVALEPRFCMYQLQSPGIQRSLERDARGTAQKGVYLKTLGRIELRVAPRPEQHRIVAKIEELFSDLDAGVAALERVKANLKRYRATVLKAAVEGRLTEGWRRRHPDTEPASKLLERILADRRAKWEQDQLRKFKESGKTPPKGWKEKYEEPETPNAGTLSPLPRDWRWASVDQLITYLRNGWSLKPTAEPPGYRLLRISAVRPRSVDLVEVRYVREPLDEVSDYFIEDGDLLFTRYNGSVDLLGVCGLVRGCSEPTLHPDKLIRIKTVIGEPLNAYVEIASNVGESRGHMKSRARTTAGQTGISGPDVRQMPIPLPPLAEQAEIVAEVDRRISVADAAEQQVEHALQRAARLRQAILKRAFEGRLVLQDSADSGNAPKSTRSVSNNATRNHHHTPRVTP